MLNGGSSKTCKVFPDDSNQLAPASGNHDQACSVLDVSVPEKLAASPGEGCFNVNNIRFKQPRAVRVFLSSTFHDFALERDYLRRYALPQLRKFGPARGVTVEFVCPRWGLSSDQSSDGVALRLSLQQLDTCPSFFVGMIGERYGWHLDPSKEDELLSKTLDTAQNMYPWIVDYRDRSVNE
mmetsp:Transcript_7309/g.13171  ORF Transcript_7309/g.13171 Transcript_7309/m.13171 type:complete len:181 (-) Transcript_7309:558-1100(-)